MLLELILSDQIRAARALLRWSSADLARHSGIGTATIKRMEVMDGVPSGQVRTIEALRLRTRALSLSGAQVIVLVCA